MVQEVTLEPLPRLRGSQMKLPGQWDPFPGPLAKRNGSPALELACNPEYLLGKHSVIQLSFWFLNPGRMLLTEESIFNDFLI